MEALYQVNKSTYVDGRSEYWVSRYSEDGYVGTLADTVYEDGADATNWCLFHGTKEECEEYVRLHQ